MPDLVIHLRGPLRIATGDGRPLAGLTRRGQAMLVCLALQPGMRAERGYLAELLWSDRSEEQSRASLRQELSVLKRAVPEAILAADRQAVWLDAGAVHAGLIADNIHVHAAAIRMACAAKTGPGQIFLVTDAMSTAGSDINGFTLNGRHIRRSNGRLTLSDGTLAGADLDMPTALSVMIKEAGISSASALGMATSAACGVLKNPMGFGSLVAGGPLHAIHLSQGASGEIRFVGKLT